MIGGKNNDLGHPGDISKGGALTVMTPDLRREITGKVSINHRGIEIGGTGVAQDPRNVTATGDGMTAATIEKILVDVLIVIPVMTTNDVVDSN